MAQSSQFESQQLLVVNYCQSGIRSGEEMTNWEECPAVERHPDKLSGSWVFVGTRVPVSALFENLQDGASVEQFLEWFPGVDRWKVHAVLAL